MLQGVNIAFNHNKSFFDHLQADEARSKRYDLMLQSHGQREGYDVSHTVSGYPWAKLGKATVVDVSCFVAFLRQLANFET
jgi:hypothetical protein